MVTTGGARGRLLATAAVMAILGAHAVQPAVAAGTLTIKKVIKRLDPRYVNVGESVPWSSLSGVPAGFADGVDDAGGPAGPATDLTCSACVDQGELAFDAATQAELDGHDHDASYWNVSGNSIDAGQFLGTTNNQPLDFKVNGQGALRLEPATVPNVIGGWSGNTTGAGVLGATIGGGGCPASLCGMDGTNVAGSFGTVGGGVDNTALGAATVGGGSRNDALASAATVGGGVDNAATGDGSTVGGGFNNTASGGGDDESNPFTDFATVGGGRENTASGSHATVGGGVSNGATGNYATVPGGSSNTASGQLSLAAGNGARADDQGAFLWADSQPVFVNSPGVNTFSVRAAGGIWLGTDSNPSIGAGRFVDTSTGAHLTTGGVWTNASSRSLKTGFTAVDPRAVLDGVVSLPITTWRYTAEPGVLHVGPTAEDFHRAFGLGRDPASIGTVDADGVALAAIQGLYEVMESRLGALERRAEGGSGGVPLQAVGMVILALGIALAGRSARPGALHDSGRRSR